MRALAWGAIAVQPLFVAAWAVSGALQAHYSALEQGVSDLGGLTARHAWIMELALVLIGLSLIALAPPLRKLLPRRPAAGVAAILFALAGLGFVLTAAFRVDCSLSVGHTCSDRFDAGLLSWHTSAHIWASLFLQLALLGTPFALARALWPSYEAAAALSAAGTGITIAVATGIGIGVSDQGGPGGLVQRLGLVSVHAWILIVAIGILYATRARERPLSAPIPARPRDFFGPAWEGEGEITPWAPWQRRLLAVRFRFTRRSTFHTDELWTVDDTAYLPGGRTLRRRNFCQLVGPARVHVTADDMPDGADVVLVEGGYRISSYKVLVPVGPLRFTLRCRDQGRMEPDGTLVDTITFRWLGLPMGRMTARAAPGTPADARPPGRETHPPEAAPASTT
jgi:hypothetical protein